MNKKVILSVILGAVVYLIVSALIPDNWSDSSWNHTLTAICSVILFLAIYYILPKKMNMYKRSIISAAVVIIIAVIIRFGFFM